MNENTTFHNNPIPNVRLSFGEVTNTYFQYYVEKVPNRFQRWMLRKVFGIRMEKL